MASTKQRDLLGFIKWPETTYGLYAAISSAAVLLGGTLYFVAFRGSKSKRQNRQQKHKSVLEYHAIDSDEDEFLSQFSRKKDEREEVAPVTFTFDDLYERAVLIHNQRQKKRKVRLLFDSNDEYVLEDAIPEVLKHR